MVNKLKTVAFLVLLLLAFLAGGWFFRQLPNLDAPKGDVEELYLSDGEAVGIFDNIPAEDLAAAEAVAAEALGQNFVSLEETGEKPTQETEAQVGKINFSDIAQIIPKSDQERTYSPEEYVAQREATVHRVKQEEADVAISLTGDEVVALGPLQDSAQEAQEQEDSRISLIAAPVKNFLIKNTEEYKLFKTRARGGYPEVDFDKQMLVVLESDSNLPDNIFEIISADVQDGQLLVTYRVNVFGLDKKTNTHTVLAVEKTDLPVEIKQVL